MPFNLPNVRSWQIAERYADVTNAQVQTAGLGVISIAELDMYRAWQMKRETLSPCYTK
ncbi:DUF4113 domain-containing protein [Cronobacter turicensis]|nr:DUF4113 domain-containing protein [Cronobacter turicensis]